VGILPGATENLDLMIAASLQDVPSDEDVSGDEDDPDLLVRFNTHSLTIPLRTASKSLVLNVSRLPSYMYLAIEIECILMSNGKLNNL
jgi:hypothetical protein